MQKNAKKFQKAQNYDIPHFLDKTAQNFAKILPEIGFFYTNNVCTFVGFSISALINAADLTATNNFLYLTLRVH